MQNKQTFDRRINKICRLLKKDNIKAAFIEDAEGSRTANLRYLSGMPSDSLLFIIPGDDPEKNRTVLIPWDSIMADKMAAADKIIPYSDFGRQIENAVAGIIEMENLPRDCRIEAPSNLTVHKFEKLKKSLPEYELFCREAGTYRYLADMRMVKDDEEIELIRKGSMYTNRLLEELELGIRKGELTSEIDVALFLERRSRTLGCEGMGFETIAAGPGRSWGIHAFPLFTANPFATKGFSISDFGVNFKGYVTDVTVSFIKGPFSRVQTQMIELVEKAYNSAAELLAPGVSSSAVAEKVTEIFKSANWTMPHSLGHGFGIDVHEAPYLRNGSENSIKLKPGMVFTLEPGLYHEKWGGIRWENDFLITRGGSECLTKSRIIRLPD